MKNHYSMLAAYNGWANERVYTEAARLTREQYDRDTGTFFKSMNGTLNHILVADRIWMKRFTGEGEHPNSLDATLHGDLASLRIARKAEDRRIIRWLEHLEPEELLGKITFTTITSPQLTTQSLAPTLTHFFNHQTHHRGQAHAILSILGREPPSLDLVLFLRNEGKEFN
ncbi:MAG: DinB family protein [Rhizobiaceae bacterium]